MAANNLCELCGHSAVWHLENKPRHTFNADAMSLNEKPKVVAESPEYKPGAATVAPPWLQPQQPLIDPVLRMALVNAGVITVEQIEAAQRFSDTMNGVAREPVHFEAPHNDR